MMNDDEEWLFCIKCKKYLSHSQTDEVVSLQCRHKICIKCLKIQWMDSNKNDSEAISCLTCNRKSKTLISMDSWNTSYSQYIRIAPRPSELPGGFYYVLYPGESFMTDVGVIGQNDQNNNVGNIDKPQNETALPVEKNISSPTVRNQDCLEKEHRICSVDINGNDRMNQNTRTNNELVECLETMNAVNHNSEPLTQLPLQSMEQTYPSNENMECEFNENVEYEQLVSFMRTERTIPRNTPHRSKSDSFVKPDYADESHFNPNSSNITRSNSLNCINCTDLHPLVRKNSNIEVGLGGEGDREVNYDSYTCHSSPMSVDGEVLQTWLAAGCEEYSLDSCEEPRLVICESYSATNSETRNSDQGVSSDTKEEGEEDIFSNDKSQNFIGQHTVGDNSHVIEKAFTTANKETDQGLIVKLNFEQKRKETPKNCSDDNKKIKNMTEMYNPVIEELKKRQRKEDQNDTTRCDTESMIDGFANTGMLKNASKQNLDAGQMDGSKSLEVISGNDSSEYQEPASSNENKDQSSLYKSCIDYDDDDDGNATDSTQIYLDFDTEECETPNKTKSPFKIGLHSHKKKIKDGSCSYKQANNFCKLSKEEANCLNGFDVVGEKKNADSENHIDCKTNLLSLLWKECMNDLLMLSKKCECNLLKASLDSMVLLKQRLDSLLQTNKKLNSSPDKCMEKMFVDTIHLIVSCVMLSSTALQNVIQFKEHCQTLNNNSSINSFGSLKDSLNIYVNHGMYTSNLALNIYEHCAEFDLQKWEENGIFCSDTSLAKKDHIESKANMEQREGKSNELKDSVSSFKVPEETTNEKLQEEKAFGVMKAVNEQIEKSHASCHKVPSNFTVTGENDMNKSLSNMVDVAQQDGCSKDNSSGDEFNSQLSSSLEQSVDVEGNDQKCLDESDKLAESEYFCTSGVLQSLRQLNSKLDLVLKSEKVNNNAEKNCSSEIVETTCSSENVASVTSSESNCSLDTVEPVTSKVRRRLKLIETYNISPTIPSVQSESSLLGRESIERSSISQVERNINPMQSFNGKICNQETNSLGNHCDETVQVSRMDLDSISIVPSVTSGDGIKKSTRKCVAASDIVEQNHAKYRIKSDTSDGRNSGPTVNSKIFTDNVEKCKSRISTEKQAVSRKSCGDRCINKLSTTGNCNVIRLNTDIREKHTVTNGIISNSVLMQKMQSSDSCSKNDRNIHDQISSGPVTIDQETDKSPVSRPVCKELSQKSLCKELLQSKEELVQEIPDMERPSNVKESREQRISNSKEKEIALKPKDHPCTGRNVYTSEEYMTSTPPRRSSADTKERCKKDDMNMGNNSGNTSDAKDSFNLNNMNANNAEIDSSPRTSTPFQKDPQVVKNMMNKLKLKCSPVIKTVIRSKGTQVCESDLDGDNRKIHKQLCNSGVQGIDAKTKQTVGNLFSKDQTKSVPVSVDKTTKKEQSESELVSVVTPGDKRKVVCNSASERTDKVGISPCKMRKVEDSNRHAHVQKSSSKYHSSCAGHVDQVKSASTKTTSMASKKLDINGGNKADRVEIKKLNLHHHPSAYRSGGKDSRADKDSHSCRKENNGQDELQQKTLSESSKSKFEVVANTPNGRSVAVQVVVSHESRKCSKVSETSSSSKMPPKNGSKESHSRSSSKNSKNVESVSSSKSHSKNVDSMSSSKNNSRNVDSRSSATSHSKTVNHNTSHHRHLDNVSSSQKINRNTLNRGDIKLSSTLTEKLKQPGKTPEPSSTTHKTLDKKITHCHTNSGSSSRENFSSSLAHSSTHKKSVPDVSKESGSKVRDKSHEHSRSQIVDKKYSSSRQSSKSRTPGASIQETPSVKHSQPLAKPSKDRDGTNLHNQDVMHSTVSSDTFTVSTSSFSRQECSLDGIDKMVNSVNTSLSSVSSIIIVSPSPHESVAQQSATCKVSAACPKYSFSSRAGNSSYCSVQELIKSANEKSEDSLSNNNSDLRTGKKANVQSHERPSHSSIVRPVGSTSKSSSNHKISSNDSHLKCSAKQDRKVANKENLQTDRSFDKSEQSQFKKLSMDTYGEKKQNHNELYSNEYSDKEISVRSSKSSDRLVSILGDLAYENLTEDNSCNSFLDKSIEEEIRDDRFRCIISDSSSDDEDLEFTGISRISPLTVKAERYIDDEGELPVLSLPCKRRNMQQSKKIKRCHRADISTHREIQKILARGFRPTFEDSSRYSDCGSDTPVKEMSNITSYSSGTGSSGKKSKHRKRSKSLSRVSGLSNSSSEEIIPEYRKRGLRFRKECFKVLDRVYNHKMSEPFRHEVKSKQVPGYYLVVKRGMSFDMVAHKIRDNIYEDILDFVDDMRLVFSNCRLFHQVGTPIYEAGQIVEKYFEKTFNDMFPGLEISSNISQLQTENTSPTC